MVIARILGSHKAKNILAYQIRKMSSSEEVLFKDVGNKGIITLNRPKALNALTYSMVKTIYPKLKEWEHDKSFVIIKGSGGKAFCAGGDVVSIVKDRENGGLSKNFFKEEYLLNCLIGTYEIPYIALLNGITMGGGVGLSVHGTYRVATEKTLFAMPETAIGLFPDVGGAYFLPRLGGSLGMYLALTGQRLKGADVMKAGVATHICDNSRLEELENALCNLESSYPEDVASILNEFSNSATFHENKDFILKPHMEQIESCFSGGSVEEIIANLEKDGSEWAVKQLELLSKMSPTSLKITFEQIRRGALLTLQECLSMEYRLTQRCCEDNDFYEGVRALLLDKDNSPKWQPSTLKEVTKETVDRYFSDLSPDRELVF